MKKLISIFVLLAFIAACSSDLRVTTQFNSTKDIKVGAPVFLNDTEVGEVLEVKQSGATTNVAIELFEANASLVKQKSAIVVNRLKPNKPLEIYNLKDDNLPVQEGDTLQGLDSMFQLGAWMVGESLQLADGGLGSFVNAFQQYLQGGEFQQNKQALQEGVKQLGKEAEGMAEALTQELDKAKTDLKQIEQDAAKAVEQLGEEMAPVVSELAKTGQAIQQQLEKFAQNVEQQNTDGQQLGTNIMESLLKTLEKVNEGLATSSAPSAPTGGAMEEPLADKVPLADKEPLASEESSASKEPSAGEQPSASNDSTAETPSTNDKPETEQVPTEPDTDTNIEANEPAEKPTT